MADLTAPGTAQDQRARDARTPFILLFAALCVVAFYASAVVWFYGGRITEPLRALSTALGALARGDWLGAFDFMAWIVALFPILIAVRVAGWFRREALQAPAANLLNDPNLRNFFFEMALLSGLAFLFWFLTGNAVNNLANAGIASGFGFLTRTAGFQINQSPFIEYNETATYGRVYLVGLQNTLIVAVLGVIFATVLGFVVGIARLSRNWIVSRTAYAYVEVMRNIPLLLWIFIWYFAVLRLLPDKAAPLDLGPFGLLNIAGYYAPRPVAGDGMGLVGLTLLAGIVAAMVVSTWARRRKLATGQPFPTGLATLGLVIGLPALVFIFVSLTRGVPLSFELPTASRFGPRGGTRIFPELIGLLLALVSYTAAYIAEIVRAGILAVNKGQTEASYALGLRPGATLRSVVVPQAMRVIIPPLTNQFLNLTKNSSLAVAIAYPDLVSAFAGTSLNQTGQAVEILLMTMLTYLTLSLLTSLFMNWYNARMALVER